MANGPSALAIHLAFALNDIAFVGRVAIDRGVGLLEYDEAFIASGLRLNPLAPPQVGVHAAPQPRLFYGLHGILADSLPDAWGEALLRRYAAKHDLPYGSLTGLDRLAMVGSRGPGALTYQPTLATHPDREGELDLEMIARESLAILEGHEAQHVDELYALAGSSGGARPKISVTIRDGVVRSADLAPDDGDLWIVKFRGPHDPVDIGLLEAAYADMARDAGIEVTETQVLPAAAGPGFFSTRRFDRLRGGGRLHVASVAGILDVDWSEPSIDYGQLLALTRKISGQSDVEQMFRRMVFNVAAHNRDDHTKQHAFLMDPGGKWRLAPAYDLTFSGGPGGEHYLSVDGLGREIRLENVLKVGQSNGVDLKRARTIVDEVRTAVSRFPTYAERYGVSATTRSLARGLPVL